MLILLLLLLKPLRLTKARMEMPKILERIAAPLRRLPLPTLERKFWRRKGSVLKT
jgi:hypothetical protein